MRNVCALTLDVGHGYTSMNVRSIASFTDSLESLTRTQAERVDVKTLNAYTKTELSEG